MLSLRTSRRCCLPVWLGQRSILCLEGIRGTRVKNTSLVFKLRGTGSLAEAGSEKAGADGFALAHWGFAGVGGIESIEDQEIAFRVVECGECGDTLKVVHRG